MNGTDVPKMQMLRLRLEITGLTPVVWRVVDMPIDIQLPALHKVLQAVIGWRNEYPARFVSGDDAYPIGEWPDEGKDPASQTLAGLCANPRQEFFYEYEPGEPWRVACRAEPAASAEAGDATCAVCVDGGRAAPPDGVGGQEGYADFLRMLDDPDADEDELEDLLEWAGGDFDPDAFDCAAVNRRLKKLTI